MVNADYDGLDAIRHRHQQHVSSNFPEPGICASCRQTWPCDTRRALAPAQKETLDVLRELLESQPWSTGLEVYSFDREEAAWARARALLEASHGG